MTRNREGTEQLQVLNTYEHFQVLSATLLYRNRPELSRKSRKILFFPLFFTRILHILDGL